MHHVKVLGVEGYHLTKILLQHVEQAVQALGVSCRVEQVSDVNAMIESGISAVPALMFNDHLIFQRIVPSANALKVLFQCILTPLHSHSDLQLSIISKHALSPDQKLAIHRNIAKCIPEVKLDVFRTIDEQRKLPNTPFLYIPGQEFPPCVNNLLYPFEYSSAYTNTLSKALGLAGTNGATLHLANIKEEPQSNYLYQQLPFQRKPTVNNRVPVKFQFTEIQTPDYLTGLKTYSNDQAIDLLMLANGSNTTPTHQQAQHPSGMKALVNTSTIPLMFL